MSDEVKMLEARIAALESTVRSMHALGRGPKGDDGRDGKDGDDGRDGKDGKDGRDGKVIREPALAAPAPLQVNYERPAPTAWSFETDARGRTIARPLGSGAAQ